MPIRAVSPTNGFQTDAELLNSHVSVRLTTGEVRLITEEFRLTCESDVKNNSINSPLMLTVSVVGFAACDAFFLKSGLGLEVGSNGRAVVEVISLVE